jgi:hypothetical protein
MNATHFHLLLNHLPVLGIAFGLGLLVFGLWQRSTELKKTALGIFVLVALATVPVYLTGEPAEDGVEKLPGVSKPFMEQHEEAASVGFIAAGVLGIASLAGLIWFRHGRALPIWYGRSTVGGALVVGILMAWVANLGGQIRHTEIRGNTSPPASVAEKH